MPVSEMARAVADYLACQPVEQRACYDTAIRAALNLTPEAYQAAIDELVDYGLVGPALPGAGDVYGCVTLTAEGQAAAARGFAPDSLPLTPASLARNSIVAASWAIDRLAASQELPPDRAALAAEIVRAVQGLLPMVQECLPAAAMESVQAAAQALLAEVRQDEPRPAVIRRALRVMGFPDGSPTLNSPLVTALPALAAALDTLLQ